MAAAKKCAAAFYFVIFRPFSTEACSLLKVIHKNYMEAKFRSQTSGLSALQGERCWVNWELVPLPDGRIDKIPKMSNGFGNAKPNVPSTWSTFAEVDAARNRFSGVGIMFTGKLLGVDLDHCIVEGEVSPEVAAFIEKAKTYVEISPSGSGLHAYLRLTEPMTLERNKSPRGKGADYECYVSGRWFTYTANPWKVSYPLRTVTPEKALDLLRMLGYPWKKETAQLSLAAPSTTSEKKSVSGDEILRRMFASKNGAKIKALYEGDTSEYGGDESSADAALCSHLAFWTDRDATRIESLWLASPLGARSKTQDREDYRKRTISFALEHCTETYRGNEEPSVEGDEDPTRPTQATQIAELITRNPEIILFMDEYKVAHVRMPVGDHFEVWPCGSSDLKYWLSNEFYCQKGKAAGTNNLGAALNILEGSARASGKRYVLHNRIAESDGALWYDLGDEKWRAVRIDASGWSVVSNPPILFRRRSYHEAQVEPVSGGDVRDLLRFVNVKEPDQQLLLLVYLVASFIPGFPHPILYVLGPQGAAKSSLLETAHTLVDPSALGSLSLSKRIDDLKQTLHHHSAFAGFDNVTSIDWDTADLFCRAVTGTGFEKRKLYTDNESVIYRVQANIAINGINLGSTRADLLERCILMELSRIEEVDRKQYAELHEEFEKARPKIFGAILDAVVKALSIRPNMKPEMLFRMADFTAWGSAIAEAIGYSKDSFLDAFRQNIDAQNDEVLDGNVVGSLIVALMEDRERWDEGNATALLGDLKRLAEERMVDEKEMPKNANALTRQMKLLKPVLEARGISWFRDVGQERRVIIRKLAKSPVEKIESVENSAPERLFEVGKGISPENFPF